MGEGPGNQTASFCLASEVMSHGAKVAVVVDSVVDYTEKIAIRLGLQPWIVLAAGFLMLILFLRSFRKPTAPKFRGTADEAVRRHRITKMRASSKLFQPPFPNGWYCVCRSSDVAPGDVMPVTAFGKELVCFRGKDDRQVGVLHAFCPHLGTHLGHGGTVENDSIVCPYHSWGFNKTGQCTQIPYCTRPISSYGDRVNAGSYQCVEAAGCVLVWFHAENEEPWYQPTLMTDIDDDGYSHVGDFPVPNWHMHLCEVSANACDWYHFKTVHQWLGQKSSDLFKFIWVRHACKTHMKLLGEEANGDKACKVDPLSPRGESLPPEMIVLEESPVSIKFFGYLPIPPPLFRHFKAEAWFQGPQLSIFKVRSWMIGECRIIFNFTPEKPFLQLCVCRAYCTRWFPRFLARFLARQAIATIEQDRAVWENKLTCNPKKLVAKDGPFAAYGTWVKQFFTESSVNWGDSSLDW
eukprot:TRINITY_DN11319_c0_g1_i2.p1 TRINITY_DN11319_c0_g1~~TRINITY_DN11319_c0_g1_i2.p1  ORF type:complete len:464 (+),score=52.73 TRINITY_DN11319_c0_g1_i2:38-1429(+)